MAAPAVWGSELSPFALKLRALLEYAAVDYRWLPADGSWLENLRAQWTIARAKRTRTALRYPRLDPLDEYPLVPYLLEADGRVQYDVSALARWLDDHHPPAGGPLFPPSPALGFVAQLVDEGFDELGLYLAHHNRWVLSAATNDAGARLAREYRRVLPPGTGAAFGRWFARRQVHRLPYLFSVAPPGFRCAVPPDLVPPARAGFPPTHGLLDAIWEETLAAVEGVLTRQPFLLGDRFTVADAAVYGQLGMNLADRTAAERMRALAPTTYAWLAAIRDRRRVGSAGALRLDASLAPLLGLLAGTFVPLMRQNARAYETALAGGERVFNEAAFERGRALYDGVLRGEPFRAVVKTFQVRVWRELCDAWAALPAAARAEVAGLLPSPDALEA